MRENSSIVISQSPSPPVPPSPPHPSSLTPHPLLRNVFLFFINKANGEVIVYYQHTNYPILLGELSCLTLSPEP